MSLPRDGMEGLPQAPIGAALSDGKLTPLPENPIHTKDPSQALHSEAYDKNGRDSNATANEQTHSYSNWERNLIGCERVASDLGLGIAHSIVDLKNLGELSALGAGMTVGLTVGSALCPNAIKLVGGLFLAKGAFSLGEHYQEWKRDLREDFNWDQNLESKSIRASQGVQQIGEGIGNVALIASTGALTRMGMRKLSGAVNFGTLGAAQATDPGHALLPKMLIDIDHGWSNSFGSPDPFFDTLARYARSANALNSGSKFVHGLGTVALGLMGQVANQAPERKQGFHGPH